MATKRIIFTFDEGALEGLDRVRKHFGAKSMAEAVRLSLKLADSLQKQARQGYDEVLVRSHRTGRRKVMAGPLLGIGTGDE